MKFRTCTNCLIEKPTTRFSTNGNGQIKSQCKKCRAENAREDYNKKDDFNELIRNWMAA